MKLLTKTRSDCYKCIALTIIFGIFPFAVSIVLGIVCLKNGNTQKAIDFLIISLMFVCLVIGVWHFCISFINMIICSVIPSEYAEACKKNTKKNKNISNVFIRKKNTSSKMVEIYVKYIDGTTSLAKNYSIRKAKKFIDFYAKH